MYSIMTVVNNTVYWKFSKRDFKYYLKEENYYVS